MRHFDFLSFEASRGAKQTSTLFAILLCLSGYTACGDDDASPTGDGDGSGDGDGTGDGDGDGDSTDPDVETFSNPEEFLMDGSETLELAFEPAAIEVGGERYCLRSFNGMAPAPTWRVPASDSPRQLRVDYSNDFTADSGIAIGDGSEHDFNHTNLHTHGFHVQPEESSDGNYYADNVLLTLVPGMSAEYRFDIDENREHEAGTFWYHPHMHGSTAIQVGSGMSGAIIIEGAIDKLDGISDARERIMLLQHIPTNAMTPLADGEDCAEEDVFSDFQAVPGGDTTYVNGMENPRLVTTPGSVERWRFVHAGVTEELVLQIFEGDDDTCTSYGTTPVAFHHIATDGITFAAKDTRDDLFLPTGGRGDIMVEMPDEEGTYCLTVETAVMGPMMMPPAAGTEVIATVRVIDDGSEATGGVPSDDNLAGVATPTLDCDSTADATHDVIFAQLTDEGGANCEGNTGMGPVLNIDCKQYDASEARLLTVGNTDEWNITSENGDHPMHIHVNPFTVCEGTINGEEITTPRWHDTLMVTNGDNFRLRMHYETYTGSFVQHCHKLHHEDQGMMEKITIE